MPAYTPAQISLALGKARLEANRHGKTMYLIERQGISAWWFGTPLRVAEQIEKSDFVVVKDIHPASFSDDLYLAAVKALNHDPAKGVALLDALRTISFKENGEAFEPEELAILIWKLVDQLGDAEFRAAREARQAASGG